MGISPSIVEVEKKVLNKVGFKYDGISWCELGNQHWDGEVAKLKYQSLGVNHTSIDLNGDDGAIVLNLDEDIPIKFKEKFQVITDYGTIEHVNNQFQAFKNVHDLCGVNGLIIHALPKVDNWEKHCRYFYEEAFFKELSDKCNYELIFLDTIPCFPDKRIGFDLIHAVFRKKEDSIFVSEKKFKKLDIFDSGDLDQTGNYTKK